MAPSSRNPSRTGVLYLCFAAAALAMVQPLLAQQPQYAPGLREQVIEAAKGKDGSPPIPIDSWIDAAAVRLHELGYLPTFYIGLRPYTRVALAHTLLLSKDKIRKDEIDYGLRDEAVSTYAALARELAPELSELTSSSAELESLYTRSRVVTGPVLNDSFHLGQTYRYDYGRPTREGFNALAGGSGWVTRGRFNLYARGEFQHAPSATGYSPATAAVLASNDGLPTGRPHFIIPPPRFEEANQFRFINALASVHLAGHQIAFGRNDEWLGPAAGGSMAWSTNVEPIYAFRINRIEPLYVPLLSRLTGPFRYEFLVGSLKGHDTPNAPWVHMEKASFKPTTNLEFGFARVALWGGKGHVPVTLGTFFRSFFSVAGVEPAVKMSRQDPGARFSTFDFNYRMPYRDHLFSLYADSFVHDNVFPISNPRRAAVRTGILISRLPLKLNKFDLRAEGAYTDVDDKQSQGGSFLFQEFIYADGYTNRSHLLGEVLGRENKGGNAWLTYHRSPRESFGFEYRRTKAAKDFIPGGTTQQDFGLNLRLRPSDALEIRGDIQQEILKAPLLLPGTRHTFGATVQLTWFPNKRRVVP